MLAHYDSSAMLAHYDRSAIETAKYELWKHPATCTYIGRKVDRKDSTARPAEEAIADDITKACVSLSKKGSPLQLIAASAMDILQMPPSEGAPEGGTQFRISCIENDMRRMVNEFKTLSEEMQRMKCSLNARNEASPTCAEVLMRRPINQPDKAVTNINRDPGADATPQETVSQGIDSETLSSARPSEATHRPNDHADEEEPGDFEVPPHVLRKRRQEERRKRKKKVVVGTCASSNTGLRGVVGGAKNLFVSRVARDPEVEEKLRMLLTSQQCSTFNLKETSHPEALFLSYKLTIPAHHVASIFSDQFPWPEGINVSWWRFKPKNAPQNE